jgi:GTP-binding protein
MESVFRSARYVLTAHRFDQLPPDRGAEVAFAGRSNVGKSSVINALTDHRGLAKISRTPGRTRQINFFDIGAQWRLVDLPGYGFARVPREMKRHWSGLLERYLRERTALRGLIIIMDARHPLTDLDRRMLDLARDAGHPVHVVLNKSDKLSRSAAARALAALRREPAIVSVQLFSTVARVGVDELRTVIGSLLAIPEVPGGGKRKAPVS